MTPIPAIEASTTLLAQVASPAARALLLGCVAGLGLAMFRVKSTPVRLFTWTAVLYAAIAMPLLGPILPPLAVRVPAFLQYGTAQPAAKNVSTPAIAGGARSEGTLVSAQAPVKRRSSAANFEGPLSASARIEARIETTSGLERQVVAAPAAHSSSRLSSIRWNSVAAGIYLAVASLFLVRFFVGLAFGRRLLRASATIDESRMTQRLVSRALASGLDFIPKAAESDFISVPVTMGALRSTILLPSSWREWDDTTLDAVVAHEMSHVARHDALTQRVSLLHRAIFWFSPLAWWLDRHLADLAEQASDEAALSCGADRRDYAKILLSFFEALHATPGRVWWQGVSMAKHGQAEQRVERILAWRGAVAMNLKKSIAAVVIALAVPAVYVAAAVHPANGVGPRGAIFAQDQATPPPAPRPARAPDAAPDQAPEPAVAATPEATPPPEPAAQPEPALAPAATMDTSAMPPAASTPRAAVAPRVAHVYPASAMAPIAPMPPLPPSYGLGQSRGSGSSSGRGYSYAYGYDDNEHFVIASGKTDSFTMSGSSDDARVVEELKKTIPGDFIWFERDGKSYIIRDQATIDRARKFWAPQEELGKKQEALGKQQEALGKQQEEIGAKMEQVRVKVPDMTADLDKLKAELKQLGSSATMEQMGEIQSEIGELQSKIGELQSEAGGQQSKVGEQMSALGEKQGRLGEQQGELGRQQAELARQANRQMKQLLDEAITKGTAVPLKQSSASL
jgi:beta-lactamase regulating signal transducer with metallopeptidase domain